MKLLTSEGKRLPFERKYLLESVPCTSCGGTGLFRNPTGNMPPTCWNCRGLGRRITPAGRELWREICRELGKPAPPRESRIDPQWLDTIFADYVKPGMSVGAIYPRRKPAKVVTAVEPLGISLRFTFEGNTQAVFSKHDVLHRELTQAELTRVDSILLREEAAATERQEQP